MEEVEEDGEPIEEIFDRYWKNSKMRIFVERLKGMVSEAYRNLEKLVRAYVKSLDIIPDKGVLLEEADLGDLEENDTLLFVQATRRALPEQYHYYIAIDWHDKVTKKSWTIRLIIDFSGKGKDDKRAKKEYDADWIMRSMAGISHHYAPLMPSDLLERKLDFLLDHYGGFVEDARGRYIARKTKRNIATLIRFTLEISSVRSLMAELNSIGHQIGILEALKERLRDHYEYEFYSEIGYKGREVQVILSCSFSMNKVRDPPIELYYVTTETKGRTGLFGRHEKVVLRAHKIRFSTSGEFKKRQMRKWILKGYPSFTTYIFNSLEAIERHPALAGGGKKK